MNYSLIVVRYAKAFFDLCNEKNLLKEIKPEAENFLSIVKGSSEFRELLSSPVIFKSQKRRIFQALFKEKYSSYMLNFFDLIIDNRRESFLADIFRYFLELIRKDLGIKIVTLSSATEIDPSLLSAIKEQLAKVLHKTIEIEGKIQPEIIGGFVVRIDNAQFDGSVSTSLKKLKQKLIKA